MGDGIVSIPCRYFTVHQGDLRKRMNIITATWRIGCFEKMADDHTKPPPWPLPKWMFSLKLVFKSSLLLNGYCGIQVRPQPAATTFALSSVFIRLQCPCSHSCIIFNFCLKKTKENTLTMMNCSINFQMFLKSLIRLFCIYILQPRNLMFFTLSPF